MIYTVGHSNYDFDVFLKFISKWKIEVIVDVRSAPYSKFCPQFNREVIQKALSNAGIKYLFLGKDLGARPDEPSCYEYGRVKFDLLRKTATFEKAIARLKAGDSKGVVVSLMCSEKNPIDCHRAILVARVLKNEGIEVKHIVSEIELIDQAQIEEQLQEKFKLEPLLFDTETAAQERIADAYKMQEEKITYNQHSESEDGSE